VALGVGAGALGGAALFGPRFVDADAAAVHPSSPSSFLASAASSVQSVKASLGQLASRASEPAAALAAEHSAPPPASKEAQAQLASPASGTEREWPVFRRAEVASHDSKEKRIWVTYKDGVYDITEFVDNHPGGNRIMLAAGKSIDAYWNLYRQHFNSSAPMEMLQAMQIGARTHPGA
jgi:sulfite oxidase